MRSLLVFTCILLQPLISISQEITGVVSGLDDGKVRTLPGVNIYWEDSHQGTVSDGDGRFTLKQKSGQHMLVFSFVGYETRVVHVNGNGPLQVILEPNLEIGEVVVTEKDRGSYLSTIDPIHNERIGGAELHKAACCSLAESFETNPSVDVSYNDAITGAKQIRLLGLDGIYSQLQTENIANFRGLATNFGLTYIPGPWMEMIQVSKGAASVVNGYGSITGQINVDFKKPDSQERLHLNLFGSADGKLEFNGNGNIRLFRDKLTTGIFLHAENLSNRIDHNHDGFLDHPLNDQYHLYNVWKYNNHKGFMIHGAFRLLSDDRYGGSVDFIRKVPASGQSAYKTGIENMLAEVVFKAGYVWPSQHVALALLSNMVSHDYLSSFGRTSYDAVEQRMNLNLVLTLDLDDHGHHNLNIGTSYFRDAFDEILNDRNMNRHESVPGLFAEYTFKPSEKLTLMTGMRGDFHNIRGTFYTPRAHVRYQPDPRYTFRLSAGKGYRTANVLAENNHLLANYRPLVFEEAVWEEAWNYGASFIRKFNVGNRDLQITAEYYRTDFLNQLVVDKESVAEHILLEPLEGKSYANSYQVDVRYPVVKNLDVTVAWRVNDVKQTIGGKLLEKPYTSRYKGLFTANYTTRLKKWMFDYTVQFNGGGRLPAPGIAIHDGSSLLIPDPVTFPSFTLMNGQITRYFRYWSIYAGGENLTDFIQDHPVLGADDPFGPGFDATNIWGPVSGRRLYAGLRFTLNYK